MDTSEHERTDSVITINNQLGSVNANTKQEVVQKLIIACQNGDLATVKELLDSGVASANDLLEDNISALHWAAINNRLSVCRYLVSKGAIVDFHGGDLNATPLHWACRYGLVYIVDFLIKNGADPKECDGQGFNSLLLAVHSSNIMLVIYILMMTDVPVDSIDPSERTALHWAAYQGDALSVEALLKFGATVNKVDNTGFTSLHWSLIKASSLCLINLIKFNANIFLVTNDGKTAFDIAIDMGHLKIFQEALKECGKDVDGNDIHVPDIFAKNPKLPKVITFLVPYIVTGLTLEFFSDYYNIFQTIFFNVGLYVITYFFLTKLILPSYINEKKKMLKSPLLSGIFSSVAAWVIINWLLYILPNTLETHIFGNILFSLLASVVVFTFFKSMFLNPGTIKPWDPKIAQTAEGIKEADNNTDSEENQNLTSIDEKLKNETVSQVAELIKLGKFDSKNFCIHTFVRRPLRSKYSHFSNGLVARFDHFCPWVYNDIGLRNHKLFIFFVLSLEAAIITFTYLCTEYFNYVSAFAAQFVYSTDGKVRTVKRPPHTPFQVYNPVPDNDCTILSSSWCNGYSDSFPLFILVAFCLFQAIWVFVLIFAQFYQISKNLTTYEASVLTKPNDDYYYSPVPIELLTELENPSNHYSISETMDNGSVNNETADSSTTLAATGSDKAADGNGKADLLSFKNMKISACGLFLKLIGISQFVHTFKHKKRLRASHFNFGLKLNCLEFWCLGNTSKSKTSIKNFFRIPSADNGQTYSGDQLVDYYKLYDYPIRKVSYKELV